MPFLPRGAKFQTGFVGGEIGRSVEDAEVLADDVVALVSLQQLRSFIPGHDVALGIKQEYGVIDDVVDE